MSIAFFATCILAIAYYFVVDYYIRGGWIKEGLFGDSFGALTSIFTGLGFIGVSYTLYLQQREIEKQDKRIQDQETDKAKQQFDNNFYKLLELHSSISAQVTYFKVDDLGFQSPIEDGKKAIHHYYTDLLGYVGKSSEYDPDIFRRYTEFDEKTHGELDGLIEMIQIIEDTIGKSDLISQAEKERYISILGVKLSDYEMTHYFYYLVLFEKRELKESTSDGELFQYLREQFLGHEKHYELYRTSRAPSNNT